MQAVHRQGSEQGGHSIDGHHAVNKLRRENFIWWKLMEWIYHRVPLPIPTTEFFASMHHHARRRKWRSCSGWCWPASFFWKNGTGLLNRKDVQKTAISLQHLVPHYWLIEISTTDNSNKHWSRTETVGLNLHSPLHSRETSGGKVALD